MNAHAMNQRNFGATVQDLLKRLDLFFVSQNTLAASNMYADKDALINHVDSIMFSSKETKKSSAKLSAYNELDLANELCAYCSRQKTEYIRYCVFDLVFTMSRSSAKEYRRHILVLLTSLAVALKSGPVLECVALWFATTDKEHSVYVASCLEKDFCSVMPESATEVKACSKSCEKFCTMLLSAYCAKYTMKDPTSEVNQKVEYPPIILLDMVQHWLLKNPGICFSIITKMDQLWHTVLTTTRVPEKSLPLSPLAGLIQWSVKLPFAPEDFDAKFLEYENVVKDNYATLQSGLHFGVLTSILVSKDCLNAIEQGVLGKESSLQLWGKSDAHLLVGGLLAYGSENPDPKSTALAVDRFSQISQIAQTSHILNCTKEQFQSLTDPLPKTKLLKLVAYGPHRKPSIDDITM